MLEKMTTSGMKRCHTSFKFLGLSVSTPPFLPIPFTWLTFTLASAVAFTDKPHDPLKSIVWNVTDGELKSDIKPFTCKRYGALAFLNKWPLLSVLAHSETFRDAALTLSSTYWDELIQYAVRNDTSLQVFGKVRGLDLISALEPLLVHMRPRHRAACIDLIHDIRGNPSLQMDHAYVIADSIDQVRRPVFEGKYQVHIDENLYSHEIFTEEGEPEIWLTGIPYPGNPMLRLPNRSTCVLCWKKSSCNCNMSKSERVLRPLVELHQCPDKGVGVRALEHIPAGMILDEYVGEIRCGDYNGDPAYAFAVKRYGKQIEQDIAVISSKEYGNWTRFINHSCDPSTEFKEYTLGDRYRVVVTSVRNIRMFEEILIHYGEGYWQNKKCLCGESNCVTKKAKAEAAEETKKLQTQAEDLFEKC